MTVVVGTAGHIDHGKTTLLRALTGIDADRLPEERRRGMTIDVGYAHMTLSDGTTLDFVDVPGHDRLVGNMLVGAGEIDAALVVVAADDGPRPQTDEHLALLDALGIRHGLVAVTKVDLVPPDRATEVGAAVRTRLAGSALADAPIVAVSGSTGAGIDALRRELGALCGRVVAAAGPPRPPRLAVDRLFSVKGRGSVVTGTLRGGPIAPGDVLGIEPGGGSVRVREVQVHGRAVDAVEEGGRTALNVAVLGAADLRRGSVLTTDPDVRSVERMLVRLATPVRDRSTFRIHIGTDATETIVGRSGRDAIELPDGTVGAVVRLAAPVAAATGDRFVLRRVEPGAIVGGVVLDPVPARGVSRRRQTSGRVTLLADGVRQGDRVLADAARLDLHGVLVGAGPALIAPDVQADVETTVLDAARAHHAAHRAAPGVPLAEVRSIAARRLRRHATLPAGAAATVAGALVDDLAAMGRLVRDGDRIRLPDHRPDAPDPARARAMERLEAVLAVHAPPPLGDAAADAGCPDDAVRELERSGRIVVIAPDLAYAQDTHGALVATALALAADGPLTPARFRDATGTSRKYVMPVLEDLDRRGILRRTPAGHVPGPRAPNPARRAT